MTLSDSDIPEPESARIEPAAPADAVHRERGSLARDLDEVQRGRPERAFNVGVILGVFVTLAMVVFLLQNRQSTTFDWLWFDFRLPLWIALLAAVGAGVVVVVTALAVHVRHQRRMGRRREAAGRLRRALTRDHARSDLATSATDRVD